MEGRIFGVDLARNNFYVTAPLSEEQAYSFCINSRDNLPQGLVLIESGVTPATFTIDNTTVKKGDFFARFKADSNILKDLQRGNVSMVLKAGDEENNYGYKLPEEQGKNQEPQPQEGSKRYNFFKIVKFVPGTAQGTLLNLIDKANDGAEETIMLEVPYDSMLNDLDMLSKSKFSFVEKGISGKDMQHEDYILNYFTEPDTKKTIVKLSPYLEML